MVVKNTRQDEMGRRDLVSEKKIGGGWKTGGRGNECLRGREKNVRETEGEIKKKGVIVSNVDKAPENEG